MRIRRSPPPSQRTERWAAFAARLEAQAATAAAERLRRFLDLDDAEVRHAHVLRRQGQPTLYLFDVLRRRVGPSGEVVRWSGWALVRGDRLLSPLAFRAAPRREPVLEALESSRTGSIRVDLSAKPEVDAALSVLARDPIAVRDLLRPLVLEVLLRLVTAGPGAAVVAGERHLFAHVDVDEDADPAELMALAADLLALAAVLPLPAQVRIEEGDFLDLGT